MNEFLHNLDFGSVPAWLTLGLLVLAAATFFIAQRDRVLKSARSLTAEGHLDLKTQSFDVEVHNDSDTQVAQVEIQTWVIDAQSRKIQTVGRRAGAVRVGPKESRQAPVIRRDPSAIQLLTKEGTYPLLEVSFRDSNRRVWMLDEDDRPRRLWTKRQQRRKALRLSGQELVSLELPKNDD